MPSISSNKRRAPILNIVLIASLPFAGCGNQTPSGSNKSTDPTPRPQNLLDPFGGFQGPLGLQDPSAPGGSSAGQDSSNPGSSSDSGSTSGSAPSDAPGPVGPQVPLSTGGAQAPTGADYDWYFAAGSVDLRQFMGFGVMPFKRFDVLDAGVQGALLDILDAGQRGAFDEAFLPTGFDSQILATGLGFMLQSQPTDFQAYGLPALLLTSDAFAPMAVAPNGPIVAISRQSLDALVGLAEPLLTDAVSEAGSGLSRETESQVQGLINDFDSFISRIEQDDASDGIVHADQHFSFTVPGEEIQFEPPFMDLRIDADLTFDLEADADRNRWLGGIGADAEIAGMPGPMGPERISFEMAIGEQRLTGLDVISLEPGPGTVSGGSRLRGEWLAAVYVGSPVQVFPVDDAPEGELVDGFFDVREKVSAAAPPQETLYQRMNHATGRLLGALTGRSDPDDPVRAQMISEPARPIPVDDDIPFQDDVFPTGDTLYLKLSFDDSGRWRDLAGAMGDSSQVPEPLAFESLSTALASLESDLGMPLADIELRTSLTDDGQFRLDIIATDLIAELLSGFSDSDFTATSDIASTIPDLSLLIIGGNLAEDRLQGRVVMLLFVQDVQFTRIQ